MVEFFQNIFNWFVLHKDEIVLFFTSSNVITFISTIILLIRQFRATKHNTISVNDISGKLANTLQSVEKVTDIKNSCDDTNAIANTTRTELLEFKNEVDTTLNVLQQKLQAILDVQSIVYSNLSDDTARTNINNILTTAKLAETAKVAALEKQLEELQAAIADKVNAVQETVQEVTTNVKKAVTTTQSATPRY